MKCATKELEEAQSTVTESKLAITKMEKSIAKELAAIRKAKDEAVQAEATYQRLTTEY